MAKYTKADYKTAQAAFVLAKKQVALRTPEHTSVEELAKIFATGRENSNNSVRANASKEAKKELDAVNKELASVKKKLEAAEKKLKK